MWDDPINAKSPSAIVGCRIICGYMIADLISVRGGKEGRR